MKIQIVKQEDDLIEFLVEREEGTYNNCNLTALLTSDEIEGLTEGQILQLAWNKVKHIAYRVFNQIEPLNEDENPIGFHFGDLPPIPPPPPSQPSEIEILQQAIAELSILIVMMGGYWMFDENSGLVKVWVDLIRNSKYTIEEVPNLHNLKEVVENVVNKNN